MNLREWIVGSLCCAALLAGPMAILGHIHADDQRNRAVNQAETSRWRNCHARCDNPTHIAKWTDDEGCLCFPVERIATPTP